MALPGLIAALLSMSVVAAPFDAGRPGTPLLAPMRPPLVRPTAAAPPDAFPDAPSQERDGVSWRTEKNGDVRCVYRSDELIAPESAAATLGAAVGATRLFSILGDSDLVLYRLPPAAPDPLDLAASPPAPLGAGELWPNYVAGFTPGWAFAPGGAPTRTSAPARVYAPTTSGSGVDILVVDTGFAAPGGVPELAGLGRTEDVLTNLDYEDVFRDPAGLPPHAVAADEGDVLTGLVAGHGTFVAGLLERSLPEASIHVLPAPFRDVRDTAFSVPSAGSTKAAPASAESSITDDARLAKAIKAQYDRHPSAVDILNLSLGTYGCGLRPDYGGPGPDVLRPPGMRALLLSLHDKSPDLVVVASAGNDQSDDRFYPAAYADDACFQAKVVSSCDEFIGKPARTQSPWLIAVGSDDPSYSNFGDWVSIVAHGTDVVSVRPTTWADAGRTSPQDDEGWWRWSGTSFAAPCVVAQIAIDRQVGPTTADLLNDFEATGQAVGCGLEGP